VNLLIGWNRSASLWKFRKAGVQVLDTRQPTPDLSRNMRAKGWGRVEPRGYAAHPCVPASLRCRARLETRSLWTISSTPGERAGRAGGSRRRLCQLARQLGPQHSVWSANVSNHWGDGGI
jgi:hypothetical protein